MGWIVPVAKATGYTIYPLRGFKMAEVMNNSSYVDDLFESAFQH